MPLQYGWAAFNASLWPSCRRATYADIPFEGLPALDTSDDTESFAFLRSGFEPDENSWRYRPGNVCSELPNGYTKPRIANGDSANGTHARIDDSIDGESDGDGSDGVYSGDNSDDDDESLLLYRDQPKPTAFNLLDQHAEKLSALGIQVPVPFTDFMRNAGMYRSVPTVTACYLDIGSKLFKVPGVSAEARALRFMNDQQCCIFWFLLLEPNKPAKVFYDMPLWKHDSDEEEGDDEDVCTDIIEDPDQAEDNSDAARDNIDGTFYFCNPKICANSFSEFILRFYIENTLWSGLDHAPTHHRNPLFRYYVEECQRAERERVGGSTHTVA